MTSDIEKENGRGKEIESNHVKKVSSVETALSPALVCLRSFENATQYQYHQDEEEEEEEEEEEVEEEEEHELSSISPLPPSASPTYVVLIVFPQMILLTSHSIITNN